MNILSLLAQSYNYDYSSSYSSTSDSATGGAVLAFTIIYFVIYAVVIGLMVISMWKLFSKAGKPGWAAIVPIYSTIVNMEVIGRPGWWFLLYFVPFLGIYLSVIDTIFLARSYGKSTGFAVGLILLPVVFYPMLAFSKDANYVGPTAPGTSMSI